VNGVVRSRLIKLFLVGAGSGNVTFVIRLKRRAFLSLLSRNRHLPRERADCKLFGIFLIHPTSLPGGFLHDIRRKIGWTNSSGRFFSFVVHRRGASIRAGDLGRRGLGPYPAARR